MDLDDLLPRRKDDPLGALGKQDLDPLSKHELEARIAALEAEIARTRAKLGTTGDVRSNADALFGKKPA